LWTLVEQDLVHCSLELFQRWYLVEEDFIEVPFDALQALLPLLIPDIAASALGVKHKIAERKPALRLRDGDAKALMLAELCPSTTLEHLSYVALV
jgi:hypothetical protein